MEGLLVLALLVALALPVAAIWQGVLISRLGARLRELERQVAARFAETEPRPDAPAQASRRRAAAAAAAAPPAQAEVPAEPAPRRALPWEEKRPAEPAAGAPEPVPAAARRGPGAGQKALAWASRNWVVVVAALALAFAGVFLVQYGIENGLLTPRMRVLAALALGAGLIALAWWSRGKASAGTQIPAALAAGGLVSVFGGIWSAHSLYGLIGANPALFGLALTGAFAVVIGWTFGPLLAAIGILGASAAPFLTGGEAGQAWLLFWYFALIALVAMAVDAIRRWGWLSFWGIGLTWLAALLVHLGAPEPLHFSAFALLVAGGALTLPKLAPWPDLQGDSTAEMLVRARGLPDKPVLIGLLAFALASVAPFVPGDGSAAEFWLSLGLLGLLLAAALWWLADSRAAEDFALLPALGFLALLLHQAMTGGPVHAAGFTLAEPGTAPPRTALVLLAIAALGSLAMAWRGRRPTDFPLLWAGASALFAPAAAGALEMFWSPSLVIGTWNWALGLIAVAALMAFLAERSARQDGAGRGRFALFALSALSMIAFALFMLLTKGALSVALAVMIALAARMDREWSLRTMGWFIVAGVAVLAWRLIVDPGFVWAVDAAPLWEVVLSFGGTILLLELARRILPGARLAAQVALESAIWSFGGIFATVLFLRYLAWLSPEQALPEHASAGVFGAIWLSSAAVQAWRLRAGGGWPGVARGVLGAVFGLIGLASAGAGLTLLNPIGGFGGPVQGPALINSLLPGYLLPALPPLVVALRMTHLKLWLRRLAGLVAGLLGAAWTVFAIRHFWRGADLGVPGVSQPELYSYTVALLVLAGVLLALAFQRRSVLIRRAALGVLGLAAAKVFLFDMSGLTGLTRVFSFLALAAVLLGIAWLDRWVAARTSGPGERG
jgi:uncharacterized membrane protein